MATSIKDNGTTKELKKARPSSNSVPTSREASPNSRGSVDNNKPNQSTKPIPNYLKPTISSRLTHDHHQPATKNAKNTATPATTSSKATLLRRRSFDRPPPAMTAPRTQSISPDVTKKKPSMKITSTSSTVMKTASSGTKTTVNKAPTPASRVMKRSSSMPKKSVSSNAAKLQEVSNGHHDQTNSDVETEHEIHNIAEQCEPEKIVNVIENELEVSSDEDVPNIKVKEETGDAVVETEVTGSEYDKNPSADSDPIVLKEQISATQVEEHCNNEELPENERKREQEVEEEGANDSSNPEPKTINDATKTETQPEQDTVVEENVNVSENTYTNNADVAVIEEAVKQEEQEEEKKGSLEQEVTEGASNDKNNESNEEEEHDNVVEAKAAEADSGTVVAEKKQPVPGKKESPTAYNDVIEETKNKLMEKRKNKVKALVGAFETVIDYESAGSK